MIVNDNSGIVLIVGALVVVVAMFSIFGKGVIRHDVDHGVNATLETPAATRGMN
jgi:hypothetical protein